MFVTFTAIKEGSTKVIATWGSLSANTTIYAYSPLKILQPSPSALVTFGASWDVVFKGGPMPFPHAADAFQVVLTADKPDNVRISAGG